MFAIFFLGAAFGICAMSFIELLIVAHRIGRFTTRMIRDMFFDVMVILLILHLIKLFTS
jgi:hypothetical protein